KLQFLNDRINQCIDALNQVRLSVHGLSHSTGGSPFIPPGISPYSQGYQSPLSQGYLPGFSHTSPGWGPTLGFPGAGFQSPGFLQSRGAFPGAAPFNPFMGLSHTTPEESFGRQGWADPLLAARISQTFPYAQYPVPPVVTIY